MPAGVEGPPARLYLPRGFTDELRGLPAGDVVVDLGAGRIRARAGDRTIEDEPIDLDFPDFRRLVGPDGPQTRRIAVDVRGLRDQLTAAPVVSREHEGSTYPVSVLGLDPSGSLRVVAESEWEAEADALVAVNREFLLQALDAGGPGQLELALDGPVQPLVLRVPGDDSRFSMLMPVRP